MRLDLMIDGYTHMIDSTDPDLLGKWIVEIFGRVGEFSPATECRVRAYPSFLHVGYGLPPQPDWIADSRIVGQVMPVRSPRELVAQLGKWLDEYDGLVKA